jgi:drug/metabolite transporter (DMT)-like permease
MISLATDRTKGALALFGASAIYGSFGLLIRVLSDMLGNYSQVAARMGIAFVLLLAASLIFGKIQRLTNTQILKSVLLGIISTGIVVFFTISVTETKIATSVFLLYVASMVSSLLLGTVFYKENINVQKIVALVLAFGGLWIFSGAFIALTLGAVMALLSGLCEGLGNIVRKSLKGVDRTNILLYQFFTTTVCASLIMFSLPEPIVKEVSFWPIVAVIVFGILQLALNNLLLYGFQHFDVNIGTVILTLELLFAALIGFFFFGEMLSVAEIIGGVLIFVASIVSAWEFKRS